MTAIELHPIRILLVDDDGDDCLLFRDALIETKIPSSLEVAHEGVRIMNLLDARAESLPHLIFLDLNMPVVSGTECLRAIRRASYLNSIPVIIFSTSFTEIAAEETFSGGANLYIQKPPGFDPLVSILKKVLQLDWRKYLHERQRSNYVISQRVSA